MSDDTDLLNAASPSSNSLQRVSGIQLANSNSILIPLNNNLVNELESRTADSPSTSVTDNASSLNNNANNGAVSPNTRGQSGETSVNPRSKRPRPKPEKSTASAAILEAKKNAQARRVTRNSNPKIEPGPEIIIMKDHLQPARDTKGEVRQRTGVVYDLKMLQHHCLWDSAYPEKPERLSAVVDRCQQLGLIDRCVQIVPRLGSREEVLTLHTEDHIEKLKSVCDDDVTKMEEFASQYDAVYIHPTTYELSLLSVGCTVDLVDAITSGKIHNGMAIIRPPGHHAMKAEYCGYCYFNNVAIAANRALDQGKASKVLIVDFDVHHGQATQQMFYEDKRVLYFSTHRYEHGNFWPNLEESNYNFIGSSNGIGFNCNVPLNKTGLGNADFLTVWHQLLLPLAYEFNPDLVIVSAGFDCVYGCFERCLEKYHSAMMVHEVYFNNISSVPFDFQFNPDLVLVSAGFDSLTGDEKGEMELTPQCCPHLLWPLLGLAGGKVAVILEGGYCIKSLAEGAALSLRALLGDPCPSIPKIENPSPILAETILNSKYMLKPYWNSLKQQTADEESLQDIQDKGLLHIPEIKYEWNQPKPESYATRDCYPVQNAELIRTINERLDSLSLSTNLSKAQFKVGIVYDDVMLKHRNVFEPEHPEKPERISNIFAIHADYGLLERCYRVNSREATEEELLLIHSADHINKMKNTKSMKTGDLKDLQYKYNSIYFNRSTYTAALISAGSVLEVVDNVMDSKYQAGVAVVRPPGHHAEVDYACGFCIFNNVALAAKYAITNHGLSRILIVDWDVHHGNGIQRMFEDDPRVLYISVHRYDNGSFFPSSADANYDMVGRGPGEGFNVNIPWNSSKMGDTEYLAAFTNIILPIAYEYNPELVLVSAGFDAAKGDPLGGCSVTPEGYAHMTHLLSSLANGKIILALEGGYNLTSIAYSMVLCTKALLGDHIPMPTLNKKVHPGAMESIQNVLNVHSEYWTVLKPFRKFLTPHKKLIPVGNYDSLDERLSQVSLKNNNESELNVPSCNHSDSSLSPDRGNISTAASTPHQQSPEAITMTLVLGNDNFSNLGACGGVISPDSASASKFSSRHTVVMSNFDDSGPAAVYPSKWCPHLEQIKKVANGRINTSAECGACGHQGDNWVCLVCYKVLCGRYVNEHMVRHYKETDHSIALSFGDFSVWCYDCETYLQHEKCTEAITAAHLDKFGEEPPEKSFAS